MVFLYPSERCKYKLVIRRRLKVRGSTENWKDALTKLRMELSVTNKFLIKPGIIFLNVNVKWYFKLQRD